MAPQFTAAHLVHLDALIKLLERSPDGLTPQATSAMADSMRRLRQSIVGPDPEPAARVTVGTLT